MNVEKIILKDGIIQNKTLMGIPVNVMIIKPSGIRNVRRLVNFESTPDLCYHNTANLNADAESHALWEQDLENKDKYYISPHIYIDDDSIVQILPLIEKGYHSGSSKGNDATVGVEICEDGNVREDLAEYFAQCFGACYLFTFPQSEITSHQSWSGKFCPRVILSRNGWDTFKQEIISMATVPLKSWQQNLGEKSIVELEIEGLLDPEYNWKDKDLKSFTPLWLFFSIALRLVKMINNK